MYQNLYIDGRWTDAESTETITVVNPATEAVVGEVPQASAKDVVRAIEAARRAFDEGPWGRSTPRDRSAAMLRIAEVIDRRREEIVAINMAEAGSTRPVAEYAQVQNGLTQFVDMAERVLPGFPFEVGMLPLDGAILSQGVVLKEAAGVAALITPFNFPFFLNIMKLGPALAAGCTTILKPSPLTPLEAFVLGEIVEEADLPPGVLNVVTGDLAAGEELTSNPLVDVVSFTGSDAIGRKVMSQASSTLKKVVLELGGKSANIVLADADLDRAAADVVAGFTLHCGQTCTALTRVIVDERVHDELVERATQVLAAIKVGNPAEDGVGMGPLISSGQRDRVERYVQQSVEDGCRVAFGGGRPAGLDAGWFVEPTLLVDVANDHRVAREEIFGPVGVVISCKDEDEAVRLANDSDYGLGGSVWAADPKRAYAVAKRLRTGTVRVNGGGGGLNPTAPFGGYKQSGLGREWGDAGMSEFLETKSISWPVSRG
jgi:acyl-CoA reductase-like NAD-dependent aldehyde dehydrogenase